MINDQGKQEKWNKAVRTRICESIHISLMHISGNGYINGGQSIIPDKLEWELTLRKLAFSSVSFPNGNVCLPETKSTSLSDSSHLKTDGKPHDIEIRAALKFFHQYKSKKRRRNETLESFDDNNESPLEVISDMGLVRSIGSPLQLAQLLSLSMEEQELQCKLDPTCLTLSTNIEEAGSIDEICKDIRPDKSGLICLVTRWRGIALRRSGKLPCPFCIKWCKGEKGLWWHQQQEHGSTHSSAATSAASQINDLAIVPYNPNSAKTPKTMSTLSNSEKKSKHVENSLESNFQTNCMIDGVEIVRQGNLFKFQKVIKNGFSPTSLDKNGASPLHWAAGSGHLNIVRYLIEECHCLPDEPQKGKRSFLGRTPLHWAARNGHLSVTEYLVETHHVDIDATTIDGTTAFCWACWQGHLDVMRYLHSKGCDVHTINSFGCNPVLWTAQGHGSLQTMRWLQSLKCNFNIINSNGHGFLHKAAQRGKRDVFEYAYTTNAMSIELRLLGPDADGCCPSDLAGMEGHEDLALFISEQEKMIAVKVYKNSIDSEIKNKSDCMTYKDGKKNCDDLPHWLKLGIKQMESCHISSKSTLESLWEANGGLRRMACAIIGSQFNLRQHNQFTI